jgi:predicted nucleotidyltransferase
VSRVDLFGSAARDEITPESDVDIVITPKPEATRRDLFIMAADVEDAVGRCVDFFIRADVEAMNNREELSWRGRTLPREAPAGEFGAARGVRYPYAPEWPRGVGIFRLTVSQRTSAPGHGFWPGRRLRASIHGVTAPQRGHDPPQSLGDRHVLEDAPLAFNPESHAGSFAPEASL